jgi:hypothetical protein
MDDQQYHSLYNRIKNGENPPELPFELQPFYKADRSGKYRKEPFSKYTIGKR